MPAALQNIRVLDLSRVLAGPWATQLLGDYGADVVKVERPGSGDETRRWGPPWLGGEEGESAYFLSTNRNKRSISVDLGTDKGRELVLALANEADVLVENFRVGTMKRFGLDYETLQSTRPGLIYCSISAYGQDRSRSGEPGYDAMMQAAGGLMSVTGDKDGEPQKVGVAVADIMTGMYAATAILAALNAREQGGSGQYIDVPLFDSQVAWLANQNMNYLIGGESPGRLGTAHPNIVPYQAFATQDGFLMLAVGNDTQFANCSSVMGLGDLASDERFATNAERISNRDDLIPLFAAEFLTRTTSEWILAFRDADVPCGPINTIGDVFESDYAQEAGLVRNVKHPLDDALPTVANPVQFSATPASHDGAPPLLGQHTDEVLREWLRYSARDIDDLRTSGVI